MKNNLVRFLFALILMGCLPSLVLGQEWTVKTLPLTFECKVCTGVDHDGDGVPNCQDFDCLLELYPFTSNTSESRSSSECRNCFEDIEVFKSELRGKIQQSLVELQSDGFLEDLERLYEFYQCVTDETKNRPYQDQGVIPECMWMGEKGSPASAFMSGLVDGAYIEVQDIIALFQNYESISEIISTYTLAGVLATIYGCEQYDLLAKLCPELKDKFKEEHLKAMLAEEIKNLDMTGASILSKENIILQGKYANVSELAKGCDFKKKIKAAIEVLDLYELMNDQINKLEESLEGLSEGNLEDWYKAGKLSVSVFEAVLNVTKITKLNKILDWINNADPFEMASLDMMRKNPDALKAINDANKEGLDGFDALEDAVQTTNKKTWPEVLDDFKRGNDFNAKGRLEYEYNEINLSDGKVLDSYIPGQEIVSRKATTLSEIQPSTFENYLRELTTKYEKGKIIRSDKYKDGPGAIDELQLTGDYYLEIPSSNRDFFESSQEFQDLAIQYDVKIKYLDE